MEAGAPLRTQVCSFTDRSLRLGRPLAGTVVLQTPLEDFVSEAQDGAEAVLAEVAMDAALSFPPALEMPFRTRTAFSSAWVRSSSSLRSWGLGVQTVKVETCSGFLHCAPGGVPHHCLPEDMPGAAPGGRWLRFTWRGGLFISFWPWGWLRSWSFSWFPAKTPDSFGTARRQGPGPTDPTGRPGLGAQSLGHSLQGKGEHRKPAIRKWALGPASRPESSDRGSEGPREV